MSNAWKPILIVVLLVATALVAALMLRSRDQSVETPRSTPETPAAPADLSLRPGPDGWFKGKADAAVTLVEFGDYQCPSCAAYHPIVNAVLKRFPDDVRLEFHHLPLISIHPNALAASKAAEAAGRQNKFWEMHDLLFARQPLWSNLPSVDVEFAAYAKEIGLDAAKFREDLNAPGLEERILRDVTRARESGVRAVPAFFIKDQPVQIDASVADFERVIRESKQP